MGKILKFKSKTSAIFEQNILEMGKLLLGSFNGNCPFSIGIIAIATGVYLLNFALRNRDEKSKEEIKQKTIEVLKDCVEIVEEW